MEELRISVRELVEFTYHGDDIRPGGTIKNMQEGMLGHKARQNLLGLAWTAEKPVSTRVTMEDETPWVLLVAGRMDAWREAPPCVEEIKLWQGKEPPAVPLDAHWAQCVCYGAIVCREEDRETVGLRVTYVDRHGKVRACFEADQTAAQCTAQFDALAASYIARERLRRAHVLERDRSLRGLRFPYPAYRAGQREMAVQVYTAIKRRRRLFASMPTGTGKSSAALFPALKALGEGLTNQLYYLTARTTQRQAALEAVERMRSQDLRLWVLTLNAKEKQCPRPTLCHPDWCPRAKGHFLRDQAALNEMLACQDWTGEAVRAMADKHDLCPFEFALSLAELADVVICDYNYAFDPAVHIQRVFDRRGDVTLLVDEAHNLLSRTRDMLSGTLDGPALRRLRRGVDKMVGRKHPLYKALTELLKRMGDLVLPEGAREGRVPQLPAGMIDAAEDAVDALSAAGQERIAWGEVSEDMGSALRELFSFLRTQRREQSGYAYLVQGTRDYRVTALALDIASHLQEVTAPLRGVIYFSATFSPLADMKLLLGGEEEDACFAMPSPFPPERLLVVQESVNTRYQHREATAGHIAARIRLMIDAHPGKYIVYFPSFAYLRQVAALLDELPCQCQQPDMTDADRQAFLAPYLHGDVSVLSLCVLGGVFAEGIDLPGTALDGVMVVGVGLPQVNLFQETLREYYEQTLGRGFAYAYQIPGMQKVAQAVGRVIRTETDRGVALLLDDRYAQVAYQALCPAHWQLRRGDTQVLLEKFWRE